MRLAQIMTAGALALLAATPAAADEAKDGAKDGGRYSAALKKMLDRTAAGTCPADIMADRLLAACREQLPTMGAALAAAGPVTGLTFISAEERGPTRIEAYKVAFAKGTTATWHIGGLHDGKFDATWSTGD